MWLAFAVSMIAASITLALVTTRPSAPTVQPATDGRVGATFEGTVPVVPEFIRPGNDRGQVKFGTTSGVEPSAQIRPGNHGGGTVKAG
jgi:hypothetical protein